MTPRPARLILSVWSILSAFSAVSCTSDHRTPVVLYSPHGRDQLELLERDFERRRPDIDVRWLDMGSQEILDRLRFERVNPQADVWFGGPTTIFDRGIHDSLLTPYRPSWAGQVSGSGVPDACGNRVQQPSGVPGSSAQGLGRCAAAALAGQGHHP
jgi:ABC-type thiamine transport system substrate-binding protein